VKQGVFVRKKEGIHGGHFSGQGSGSRFFRKEKRVREGERMKEPGQNLIYGTGF